MTSRDEVWPLYRAALEGRAEGAVLRFVRKMPGERLSPAEGEGTLCGAVVETDDRTGLATKVRMTRVGGKLQEALP